MIKKNNNNNNMHFSTSKITIRSYDFLKRNRLLTHQKHKKQQQAFVFVVVSLLFCCYCMIGIGIGCCFHLVTIVSATSLTTTKTTTDRFCFVPVGGGINVVRSTSIRKRNYQSSSYDRNRCCSSCTSRSRSTYPSFVTTSVSMLHQQEQHQQQQQRSLLLLLWGLRRQQQHQTQKQSITTTTTFLINPKVTSSRLLLLSQLQLIRGGSGSSVEENTTTTTDNDDDDDDEKEQQALNYNKKDVDDDVDVNHHETKPTSATNFKFHMDWNPVGRNNNNNNNNDDDDTINVNYNNNDFLMEEDNNDSFSSTHDTVILLPEQIFILMDGFCSYHGQYMANQIVINYSNVFIVYVCSNYMTQVLLSSSSQEDDMIPRMPSTESEAILWKEQLSHHILERIREHNRQQRRQQQQQEQQQTLGDDNDCHNNNSSNNNIDDESTVQKDDLHLLNRIQNEIPIRSIYCESDSGLADAELLRSLLNVQPCTDTPTIYVERRNKFLMHQQVQKYQELEQQEQQEQQPLPSVTIPIQKLCTNVEEAIQYANELLLLERTTSSSSKKVVVKPIRGVASESVYLCTTLKEVEQAYQSITATTIFGSLTSSSSSSHPNNTNTNIATTKTTTTIASSNQNNDGIQQQQYKPQYHDSVLVQEYVEGTEYAVDVVSRNGRHKVAAIWKYDKRPNQPKIQQKDNDDDDPNNNTNTNNNDGGGGGSFCYYQTKLVDESIDENVPNLCRAVQTTLDALGIKWGLTHNEFIIREQHSVVQNRNNNNNNNSTTTIATTTVPPVLIEVNCRQHNMDFTPLTMACIGYNALDMTLDALLLMTPPRDKENDDNNNNNNIDVELDGDEYFEQYPDVPVLRAHGCMVHLLNNQRGLLKRVHHINDIMNLPSVFDMELYETFTKPGQSIVPTRDIRTDAGWVQLINPNFIELQKDYQQIIDQYMPNMFEIE